MNGGRVPSNQVASVFQDSDFSLPWSRDVSGKTMENCSNKMEVKIGKNLSLESATI